MCNFTITLTKKLSKFVRIELFVIYHFLNPPKRYLSQPQIPATNFVIFAFHFEKLKVKSYFNLPEKEKEESIAKTILCIEY